MAQGSQLELVVLPTLSNEHGDGRAADKATSVKMESPSSSFHSFLVSASSSPMPSPAPEVPLMPSASPVALQCACNEVELCKAVADMHSADAGETLTSSELAVPTEKSDLPAAKVNTVEAPVVAVVPHPAAPRPTPPPKKMDPLTVDEIDEIADEWSLLPNPATVAKTRTRKQQLTARAPPSSRVPSHFKKSARPSTSSSHTPSKTPSPQPSSLAQTRTPSPAAQPPPPVVVDTTLSSTLPPLISAIPLLPMPTLPSPPKPVQARRTVNRATKPAPVARASPAISVASSSSAPVLNPSHPATGRPSKACIFCRRRKIGCTQSETSPDSCQ